MSDRPISAEDLRGRVKSYSIGNQVYAFSQISSTNDYAKRLAREGMEEGALVIADHQTRGRGRYRRQWHSPAGKGLWFSIILRPAIELDKVGLMPLLAAVSVAQSIEIVAILKPEFSWPNDLLLNKKKVAGILIESEVIQDRLAFLILGIGINVSQARSDFPENLQKIATSLFAETNRRIDRTELLIQILRNLDHNYRDFKKGVSDKIVDEWMARCNQVAKKIMIRQGDGEIEGVFLRIDDFGRLIIRTSCGVEKTVTSGELI